MENKAMDFMKWMWEMKNIHYTDDEAMSRTLDKFRKDANKTSEKHIRQVIRDTKRQ